MRPLLPLALLVAAGCLEYSPHAVDLDGSERDLHSKALARLAAAPAPAVVRFAVVGDTQLAFDEAEEAVDHLNGRADLAFVVQAGDFTNFGLLPEYRLMNHIFERLRVPYFVVIGIHEYLGNGEDIYDRMFGPTDFSFTFAGTRFVLFDSNSREFAFDGSVPDLGWLAAQLPPGGDGTYDRAVLFSHVAPGHGDFDPRLEEPYVALLRSQPSVISFHAHEHRFRFDDATGTPIYLADSVNHRSYLVATLLPDGAIGVERISF
jgi:3',5'-cyclic AMP phosphodiesterase CpdA